MANLNQYFFVIQEPRQWSAAHKPIVYELFPFDVLMSITNDGGKALVTANSIPFLPFKNDLVFISGSTFYNGFHIVSEIISPNEILLNTPFVANDFGAIKATPQFEVKVLSGYKQGENYPNQLPLTDLGNLSLEINQKTVTYKLDVSGLLQSIFTIKPPQTGIDFNLFNQYRLSIFGIEFPPLLVANAAIDNPDFDLLYGNTGKSLNDVDTIYFACGTTINSVIDGQAIRSSTNDGCIENGFTNDFNNDFLKSNCP